MLSVDDGHVHVGKAKTNISYWSLVKDKQLDLIIEPSPVDKPSERRYVGSSVYRLDIPSKVFGAPIFIQDLRFENMLHARIVRPPREDALLERIDTSGLTGATCFQSGSFVAALSDSEVGARKAAEHLEDRCSWHEVSIGNNLDEDWLTTQEPISTTIERSLQPVSTEDLSSFSADYSRAFQAHAALSPSMAVAYRDGDKLTVWAHGQGMYPLRGAIAATLGIPTEAVTCIHAQSSGVYGHNGADDAACDAALIAWHTPNRHIRLQYSRSDEFAIEPLGSAMKTHINAMMDKSGHIVRWDASVTSGPHSARPMGRKGSPHLRAANLKETPIAKISASPIARPNGGGDRNIVPLYDVGALNIEKAFIPNTPTRVSALRGLGAFANVFAIESCMSELADLTQQDHFEFRLKHLSDSRAIEVLQTLQKKCQARSRALSLLPGIAMARYKNSGAYCAIGAFIDPSKPEKIRVTEVIAVVDAGLIVNPDGAENQIEGGVIQSTSWTLKESVDVANGTRSCSDWASYPILTFSEVPEVDVSFINPSNGPSLGVGEAAQGPCAAAIANAVSLTWGKRIRSLPLHLPIQKT